MKITLLFAAIALPVLLGETACSRGAEASGVIVQVDNRSNPTGWLGVSIQDMTDRLAKTMNVKTREGALINEVIEDSPAEDAGLKDEDIIVEVDGKKIADADELRSTIKETKPGTKVNIAVMRKDQRETFGVTIGKTPRHRSYTYSFPPLHVPRIPRLPRDPMHIEIFSNIGSIGMKLSTLNKQLGKYFGAPDGRGVLVEEVEEDSKAAKAGFQAGDVITKVGKESVEESRDVVEALKDRDEGEKVDIEILRKGATRSVTLEVPDMKRHRRHWLGSGEHGEWFDDFNIEIDPPDVDQIEEGQGVLKHWMHDLKKELNRFDVEIKRRVEEWREELKSEGAGLMS